MKLKLLTCSLLIMSLSSFAAKSRTNFVGKSNKVANPLEKSMSDSFFLHPFAQTFALGKEKNLLFYNNQTVVVEKTANAVAYNATLSTLKSTYVSSDITITPYPFRLNDEITITIKSNNVCNNLGGQALYMHSGVGIIGTVAEAWTFKTGNWGQDDGIGKMTDNGDGTHSITITPQTYYSVPLDKVSIITRMALVFRTPDGATKWQYDEGGCTFADYFVGVNALPVLAAVGNQIVVAEETLTINLTATDANVADNLVFSATGLPAFATLTNTGSGTATIAVTPQAANVGAHSITISVTDGENPLVSENINITVVPVGQETAAITASNNDGYVSDAAAVTANNPFLTGVMKLGSSDVAGNQNLTSVIIPFKLPTIPAGKEITDAELSVYVSSGRQLINSNVDLYGLTYKKTDAIFAADYFSGAFGNGNGSDTGIEDDYFAKNVAQGTDDTPRTEKTSTGGNANLAAYLKAQYTAGAVADDWVFLRLSMDNPAMTGSQFFTIEEGASANPPKLNITFNNIVGPNAVPVLAAIGDKTVETGKTTIVDLMATDTDAADNLVFSATNLPAFATLTNSGNSGNRTATIALTPQAANVGVYPITISVTDNRSPSVSENINITVKVSAGYETTSITASAKDGYVYDIADVPAGGGNPLLTGAMRLGKDANVTSVIIPFKLPTIPTGKEITDAALSVYVSSGRAYIDADAHVDLYGLTYKNTDAISAADYFSGDFGNGNGSDTGIEDDYFAKIEADGTADAARTEKTSTVGNANLATYLKAQYTAGAVAGDWVFLRLSMDKPTMKGYQFFTIEDGASTDPAKLGITFSNVIPIELLSFKLAITEFNKVKIAWSTVSEKDNDYFEVESSTDGANWRVIATVGGAGNSERKLDYQVVDTTPLAGTSYYRLKQTDYNGGYSYSDIRIVEVQENINYSIYPNPVAQLLTMASNNNSGFSYKIYNYVGSIVADVPFIAKTVQTVDVSRWPPGIYLVHLYAGNKLIVEKILVR